MDYFEWTRHPSKLVTCTTWCLIVESCSLDGTLQMCPQKVHTIHFKLQLQSPELTQNMLNIIYIFKWAVFTKDKFWLQPGYSIMQCVGFTRCGLHSMWTVESIAISNDLCALVVEGGLTRYHFFETIFFIYFLNLII